MLRISSLVGLASSYNALSGGALGNLGNLGTAASALGLMQALQDGNTAGMVPSFNAITNHGIAPAINTALSANGVPYLAIAMALNDFENQAMQRSTSLIGMCFGNAANDVHMKKVA